VSDGQQPELRRLELLCDPWDFPVIANWIEANNHRRLVGESDSNQAGALIATAIRELNQLKAQS
jgi:hypothetical protein